MASEVLTIEVLDDSVEDLHDDLDEENLNAEDHIRAAARVEDPAAMMLGYAEKDLLTHRAAAVKLDPGVALMLGLAIQKGPFASLREKNPTISALEALSSRSKLDSVLGTMREDPLARVKAKYTF